MVDEHNGEILTLLLLKNNTSQQNLCASDRLNKMVKFSFLCDGMSDIPEGDEKVNKCDVG